MKRPSIRLILIGIIQAAIILLGAYYQTSTAASPGISSDLHAANLKKEALEILETKCNVCHKKQNPFMVFKEKNLSKRAKKIYQMVFIERRMPKGNEIRLTNDEYLTLEKWLKTQDIY